MATIVRTTNALGLVIRAERKKAGLSQAELATLSGVSRPWLSRFESGKRTAEVGLMFSVLHALNLGIAVEAVPPAKLPEAETSRFRLPETQVDPEVVARMRETLAALPGLDPEVVARMRETLAALPGLDPEVVARMRETLAALPRESPEARGNPSAEESDRE